MAFMKALACRLLTCIPGLISLANELQMYKEINSFLPKLLLSKLFYDNNGYPKTVSENLWLLYW